MSALFLKELADKTRRGLRGRVEAGASAGGLSYGYDVVAVPDGEDRGARTMNHGQAAVVARSFLDTSLASPQRRSRRPFERKIANLGSVVADSGGSAAILGALREAEARQAALEAHLATAEAPAPRLMPNVAELYREKVAMSHEALTGEDAAVAREQVRALIDRCGSSPPLPIRRRCPRSTRSAFGAPSRARCRLRVSSRVTR